MRLWASLIRFGFRLLYNELAFTYDLVSWIVSLGSWRCWVRSSLDFLPPASSGTVLELAHGTGNLQLDLRRAGYRAIGMDFSPAMGRIAQNKLVRAGQQPDLIRGRAQQLPFANGTFAAVVSTFPTDFIVNPDTLRECYRVLKTDGVLVIVPNAVMTSKGWLSGFIEFLYRITGQRSTDGSFPDVRPMFEPYGFAAEIHEVDCPRSRVTVIVARKRHQCHKI